MGIAAEDTEVLETLNPKERREIEEVLEGFKGSQHPALSPRYRAITGHVSERNEYYREYYQKNKDKIRDKRRERYQNSKAVRRYQAAQSKLSRARKTGRTGPCDRTLLRTEEGQRLYSIRHAAIAIGYSIEYMRDLINKGVIPEATVRDNRGWRLYTEGQVKLLRRAFHYYYGPDPWRAQAMMFVYWNNPEAALAMTASRHAEVAVKEMPRVQRGAVQNLRT